MSEYFLMCLAADCLPAGELHSHNWSLLVRRDLSLIDYMSTSELKKTIIVPYL